MKTARERNEKESKKKYIVDRVRDHSVSTSLFYFELQHAAFALRSRILYSINIWIVHAYSKNYIEFRAEKNMIDKMENVVVEATTTVVRIVIVCLSELKMFKCSFNSRRTKAKRESYANGPRSLSQFSRQRRKSSNSINNF